ncbi:MAG: TldD/PmbA family protein [bacterium]|nr:TldD/PmbA family protein [Bacillota bacterium]
MRERELAHWVVAKGQEKGAKLIEAFLLKHKSFSVQVHHGKIESIKQAQEAGLGIRVIIEGRMGYAYTSQLDTAPVEEALSQAIANANKTAADECNILPEPADQLPKIDIYDPLIEKTPVEEKIELAKAIEEAAFNYDRRVARSEQAAYEDTVYQVAIVNSRGIDVSYQGSFCGGSVSVVAEENGDTQTGYGMDFVLNFAALKPEAIGREAGEEAVAMLGARKVSTQRVPIVMSPRVAAQFLGVLVPALSGEAVQKGRSLLAGKLGEAVAAKDITLIDDGTLPQGINSSPVDGEGVPSGKTVLIEDGVLKSYLHNTYSAAKDGTRSTGNASRPSYRGTPEIGPSNIFLEAGRASREELLQDISQGFYITEVLGMHTANPISGDFSVGAAGLWIEKGELAYPVRGVAVAANILELFQGVEAVGNDLRFYLGYGTPTLRFRPLPVSGE